MYSSDNSTVWLTACPVFWRSGYEPYRRIHKPYYWLSVCTVQTIVQCDWRRVLCSEDQVTNPTEGSTSHITDCQYVQFRLQYSMTGGVSCILMNRLRTLWKDTQTILLTVSMYSSDNSTVWLTACPVFWWSGYENYRRIHKPDHVSLFLICPRYMYI